MATFQYTNAAEELTLNYMTTDLETEGGQVFPGILLMSCTHKGRTIPLEEEERRWPGELDIEPIAGQLIEYLTT